ncbi:MAG: hypothetical protein RL291_1897 [Pseudomonadota bacterium]
MRLEEPNAPSGRAWPQATGLASGLLTPSVRLGVTGLARAGKTVFITSLVRNLTAGGRLPFFPAMAQGRILRVDLDPQPDDDVPRFTYEEHLARLAAETPSWPESTRAIAQLRLAITYRPTSLFRRTLGSTIGAGIDTARLNLDIVDYPGEWLVDLGLIDLDYKAWSKLALNDAEAAHRKTYAHEFAQFIASLPQDAENDEAIAIKGADVFKRYLGAARAAEPALATLTPGRFLMPGELDGTPLLTFFPLPADAMGTARKSLAGMLERRYESYKRHVVEPFFKNHFARLDRQIVLVDALAALNAGPAGIADLANGLEAVLKPFRAGNPSWFARWFSRRVDRVLVAATKADHLLETGHDKLEALLGAIVAKPMSRATDLGADARVMAIAALRATREITVRDKGEDIPCLRGTPLAGQHVGTRTFDGKKEAALFPGDLPKDLAGLVTASRNAEPDVRKRFGLEDDDVRVLRFAPPRVTIETAAGTEPPFPHIRMDRAIDYLIGDRLQ